MYNRVTNLKTSTEIKIKQSDAKTLYYVSITVPDLQIPTEVGCYLISLTQSRIRKLKKHKSTI